MAETKKATARGGRRASAAKAALQELLAVRDEVDAETVSLREREEAVLAEFVAVKLERETVIKARDAELAKLAKRADEIRAKAVPKLDEIDGRTAVTLLALTDLGRNADQVAKMTGVPVKRVRAMVREARESVEDEKQPAVASGDAAPAEPSAKSSRPAAAAPAKSATETAASS